MAVITGANTGMGYETALELAKRGCRVYLACRPNVPGEPEPGETAAKISKLSGNPEVHFRQLDVSLTESVRDFADELAKDETKLDILINNAGLRF